MNTVQNRRRLPEASNTAGNRGRDHRWCNPRAAAAMDAPRRCRARVAPIVEAAGRARDCGQIHGFSSVGGARAVTGTPIAFVGA
jgi:hypothetical protein